MTAPTLRVETAGGLCRLILDRPPVNVLDIATLEALAAALAGPAHAPGVKAVVLSGAGKAFCAGVDVADHTADRVARMLHIFHEAVRGLLALEVPTVALVHGGTLGGGMELALACDIIVARDDVKMGQPEIKLGVFPPVAAALLPRLVGRHCALDLVLTGRVVGAAEAQRLGLVQHVLAADGWDAAADAWLGGLRALSGPALRLAKRAVTAGEERPFDAALEAAEALYLDELMATADAHEGLAAFLEKRAPVWKES
jgi:cyclohexa-1,5-dienecarbonyl-CoA hydratase